VLDPELKYGLCVLGSVPDGRALTQAGGRAGDVLVLTKPIGSGIAAQAIKSDRLAPADIARVVEAMKRLNADARDAALAVGAHAATDVTGFGLLGHLHHLVAGSGVAARLRSEQVPVFDFARQLAEDGVVPGGTRRNADYVASQVDYADALSEAERLLLCDAQTSGGLLLAVAAEDEKLLRDELEAGGALASATIGELVEPQDLGVGRISVE
jgi:selenide,water dikinase